MSNYELEIFGAKSSGMTLLTHGAVLTHPPPTRSAERYPFQKDCLLIYQAALIPINNYPSDADGLASFPKLANKCLWSFLQRTTSPASQPTDFLGVGFVAEKALIQYTAVHCFQY